MRISGTLREVTSGERAGNLELVNVWVSFGVREGNPQGWQRTLQFGSNKVTEYGKNQVIKNSLNFEELAIPTAYMII